MRSSQSHIANMQRFSVALKTYVADIESYLLDWDRFKSKEILNKLKYATEELYSAAKAAEVNAPATLLKHMLDAFEYSEKGEIALSVEDVDVLLRANDIFAGITEFNVHELMEVTNNEASIFDECSRAVKKITSPFRLKRYAKENGNKIKETQPIETPKAPIKNVNSEPALKPIPHNKALVLEKFRFELVKNAQTIDKALSRYEKENVVKALLPAAEAVVSIKNAAEKVGAAQAAQLAEGLNAYLSKASIGETKIDADKLKTLFEANEIFKKIAAQSVINANLKISEQVKKITTPAIENQEPAKSQKISAALEFNLNKAEINRNALALEKSIGGLFPGAEPEVYEEYLQNLNKIKSASIKISSVKALELSTLMINYIKSVKAGATEPEFSDVQTLKQAAELFKRINSNSGEEEEDEEISNQISKYSSYLKAAIPEDTKTENYIHTVPALAIEKFRFELVKNTQKIDKALDEFSKEASPKALLPAAQAVVAIRVSAAKVGAASTMDLAASMEEYLNLAANGVIAVETDKLKTLIAANGTFKSIAEESALGLLDKLADYNEQIDRYADSLDNFLHEGEDDESNDSAYSIKPIGIKGADVEDLNLMTQKSIENITKLSEAKNLELGLDEIKRELMDLHTRIDSIAYSLADAEDRGLYTKARISAQSVGELINKIDTAKYDLSDRIGKIIEGSKSLYEDLFAKRSVKFEETLLGLKEFAIKLGEAGNKKVKIGIRGANVAIGADVLPVIETALPLILKKIIMCSIETPDERINAGKSPAAKIIFKAEKRGDALIIEVTDDGRGEKVGAGDVEIKNVYDKIKTAQGKLEAISGESIGGKYRMTFPIKYSIINCLLFTLNGNVYAAPIAAVDAIAKVADAKKMRVEEDLPIKIIQAKRILEIEKNDSDLNDDSPALVIGDYDSKLILVFDSFIGSAEIAPLERSDFIESIPFILAGAIYQDRPIFIIDIEKLKRSVNSD